MSVAPFPVPLGAVNPPGSLIYQGVVAGEIASELEIDEFTIELEGPQTITLVMEPGESLQPTIELLGPQGTVLGSVVSNTSGTESVLPTIAAADPGVYTVRVSDLAGGTGGYTLSLILNAGVEAEEHGGVINDTLASAETVYAGPISADDDTIRRGAVLGWLEAASLDVYRFDLVAGESLSLAVKALGENAVDMQLTDDSETTLAIGVHAENVDSLIYDFVAPADGSYYAQVDGQGIYSLLVVHNAGFDGEPNDVRELGVPLPASGVALGALPGPKAVEPESGVAGVAGGSDVQGPQQFAESEAIEFGAGRLIVQFTEEAVDGSMAQMVADRGGRLIRELPSIHGAIIELPNPATDVLFAAAAWSADRAVTHAEPDYVLYAIETLPDDPLFDYQWALHNTGETGGTDDSDIDAPEAWQFYTGSQDVVIAVIDTGVDYTHEDLAANMWVNPGEIAGDGIDNDGNGYIDDIHGIDTANDDSDPFDDGTHGTHVAGTIAAVGDNGTGIVGTMWNAQIMALKFLHGSGSGYTSDALAAVEYMTMMKTTYGINVVASNNSWGGGGEASQAMSAAIQASIDAGIMFVAAAGNDGNNSDETPSYPAAYDLDGIISVAATDHNDLLALKSNYGVTSVDLAAPGVDILSTIPGDSYMTKSGTSMAAPHVTAAAAMLMAFRPDMTMGEIKAAIVDNVDPVATLEYAVASGGRLNLANILLAQRDSGDYFRVEARTGDTMVVRTATPGGGSGEFVNGLNPALELYGPDGALITSDQDSAPDGINAELTHLVAQQGTYWVRVVAQDTVGGEYLLRVEGATGGNPAMEVVRADPDEGWKVGSFPETFHLVFSEAILTTGIAAADLVIGNSPALSVTAIDGRTLAFEVNPAANRGDGSYAVRMVPNAVRDLQGRGNLKFTSSFELDSSGPRIIETLWNGAPLSDVSLSEGPMTFTATFDERIVGMEDEQQGTYQPSPDDVVLYESLSDRYYTPAAVSFNAATDTLSVSYAHLVEGLYTLRLLSGDNSPATGALKDIAGNDLDGEPTGAAADQTPTGDGTPGGDYWVDFTVDRGTIEAAAFGRLNPLGSLMSVSSDNWGLVNDSDDRDDFTFYAAAGQTISAVAIPDDPGAILRLELVGLQGPVTSAAAVFGEPGQPVVLPPVLVPADGVLTLLVGSDTSTTFLLDIGRDLITEVFDTADGFELAIDGSRLGVGLDRYGVIGTAESDGSVPDVDEYTLDLTGRIGNRIDVVLDGQEDVDFSTAKVELLDTDGVTVLATAVSDPMGGVATNYDLAILGFPIPADGVYTLRVESLLSGDYGMIVTDSLLFESEPNASAADPLRSFDGATAALGFLEGYGAPLLFAIEYSPVTPATIHTVNPMTGEIINSFLAPPHPPSNPFGLNLAFDGKRLFFNAGAVISSKVIHVLDPHDGTVLDSFFAEESAGLLGLAYLDGKLFVADYRQEDFDVYDAQTFEYIRSMPMPARALTGFSGDAGGHVLVAVDQSTNSLIRIDPETGLPLDSAMSGLLYEQGMAVVGNELFVSGTRGPNDPTFEVAVYDTTTFAELRRFTLPFDTHIGGLGGDGILADYSILGPDGGNSGSSGSSQSSDEWRGDSYQINLSAGDPITAFVQTPFVAPDEPILRKLNASLSVIGPDGQVVASDPGTSGGENPVVSFVAPEDGTYVVQVDSESGQGEYVLRLAATLTPSFSIGDVAVLEGDGGTREARFTVSLSHPWYRTVSAEVDTADGSATVADGDYQPIGGLTLSFDPDSPLTQTVTVQITGDDLIEEDQTFAVHLSKAAFALIDRGQGTGTILNDDGSGQSLLAFDTTVSNDVTLVRNGKRLEILDNHTPGTTLVSQPSSPVEHVLVVGTNPVDDRLVVDFSGGDPIPGGGIAFHGGYQGDDRLAIVGGSFTSVTFSYTPADTIDLDGSILTTTGLEQTEIAADIDRVTFSLSAAGDRVQLHSIGEGALEFSSPDAAFAAARIAAGTQQILILGNDGDDTFLLGDLSAEFSGSLAIDPGDGSDRIVLLDGAMLHAIGTSSDAILQSGDQLLGSGSLGNLLQVAGGATIAPGFQESRDSQQISGFGTLSAQGISFDADAVLQIELGGNTPGSGYDRLQIAGSVTIDPAAVLDLSLQFVPTAGDQFLILENDGTGDPISGSFAGFDHRVPVMLTAPDGRQIPCLVDYEGGDGNDLVLTPMMFDVLYVDDDFTQPVLGEDPDGQGGAPMYFGFDSFATIQEALDVVPVGGTIHVLPGLYVEDLVIDRPGIELVGDNIADPSLTVIRGVAMGSSPSESPSESTAPNVAVHAGGIHLRGLTFRGPDPVSGSFAPGMAVGGNQVEIDHCAFEVTGAATQSDLSVGLWTYATVDNPVADADLSGLLLHDNTFTQYGEGAAGYRAIGIGPTDSADSVVTLQNNQIATAAATGIAIERSNVTLSQNTIAQAPTSQAATSRAILIGSATSSPTDILIDDNQLTGHAVGVLVRGGRATLSGNGYAGSVTAVELAGGTTIVQESITEVTTGLLVRAGGQAIVDGSALTGLDVGIDVFGGTTLIKSTDLTGNRIGLLIQGDGDTIGTVDAGRADGGPSVTGLGDSPGQNVLTGYTSSSETSGAIVNLNDLEQIGAAGPLLDVPAFGNSFTEPIEAAIFHDLDDPAYGLVDYVELSGLEVGLSPTVIDEGGSVHLTGSFSNLAQTHHLTIDFGDADPELFVLDAGVFDFDVAHVYADDGTYTISVSLVESAYPAPILSDTATVVVNNVIPTARIARAGSSSAEVDEGAAYQLTFDSLFDPGDDEVEMVVIGWGDGTASDSFVPDPLGGARILTHVFDDGPAGRTITATVIDEDGAFVVATLDVAVANVAPTGYAISAGAVHEGEDGRVEMILLSSAGYRADPSDADTAAGFVYGFDLNNDGDFDDPFEIDPDQPGANSPTAAVPAIYLDDDPGPVVRVVLRDKDGGQTEHWAAMTVLNVAPVVNITGDDLQGRVGEAVQVSGSFADPGNDLWTATIDFGDGSPLQPLALAQMQFDATYQYAAPGEYTITIAVDDGDGGIGSTVVGATIHPDRLRVVDLAPTAVGFDVQLSRSVDLSVLNLWDGSDASDNPADVVLTGGTSGTVYGSMAFDAADNTFRFVKTGGALIADTYTVRLVSGTAAWQDTAGELLDGDDDRVAGGDFVATFTVAENSDRLVYLPDFARGPGQPVHVPVDGGDLSIRIDDATDVTAVDFDLRYDPAMLDLGLVRLPAEMPADWSLTQNRLGPGLLRLTVSGTTPLSGSHVKLVVLDAAVSATAVYGDLQIIDVANLQVNEGGISAVADSAVHKAVYLGDSDGNELYSGFDASLISRSVVRADFGYSAHPWTDPRIIGDTTGDGTLSGLDASYVAQAAVGIDRPEIPELPAPAPPMLKSVHDTRRLAELAVDKLLATYWP